MTKREKLKYVGFQFISHCNERYGYLDGIRLVLEGGCKWVQLRMKNASEEEVYASAIEAKKLCDAYDAVLIIDDHVNVAKKAGADGVHLGKNDMPVDQAREILGEDAIIGGTANTIDDVRALAAAGADYIGCGPFRYTTTKEKLSPVLGLEGYKSIINTMNAENISLPIVAIGGITNKDTVKIMATGVNGIAVSGAILNSPDPAIAVFSFKF